MKNYYLLLFALLSFVSKAQSFELLSGDTINFTDATGLKQKHWIFYGKTKKIPGYKDDSKVEEGNFLDNKKTGLWKAYFASGNVKNELTFVNNRPSGYAKMYYDNGKIEEEGLWENNKWVGQYKRYHENGNPAYEWNYNKDGKREGVQKYFHENGKIMIEGAWADGKESGVIKEFNEDGSLKAEKNFNNGALDATATKVYDKKSAPVAVEKEEPKVETPPAPPVVEPQKPASIGIIKDGYNKVLGKNGKPAKEGTFKNGLLVDGKQYEYEGDKLARTLIIKNGKVSEVVENK